MAVLGLRFCARAFSSCGERGSLFIAVHGPLTVAASLVAEHRLQTRRLSSSGSRAQLLRGMWDLPRPGLQPVSPALAGRFSTTAPPGKPNRALLNSKKNHRSTHIHDGNDLRPHNLFFSYCRLLYFVSQFILLIWFTKSDNMNRHRIKWSSLSTVSHAPVLSLTKVGSGTSPHKLSANHSLAAEKSER